MTSAAIVIPARLGSTRLKRKLLRNDTGKPLLVHTVERALEARAASDGAITRVIVAVDHRKLIEALADSGVDAEVARTEKKHTSGTDRIAEAVTKKGVEEEIILNLQGDEPEVRVDDFLKLIQLLDGNDDPMATLAAPADEKALNDPNTVKVVLDREGHALYFSRAPIPCVREPGDAGPPDQRCLRHMGFYAYRRDFLIEYANLPASRLETRERLEQLRALEAGYRIRVGVVKPYPPGIDTEEDYRAFVARMKVSRTVPNPGGGP